MQGDSILNPIEIDNSKDGQLVQSVEPSYRLKRKRTITSFTEKLISNMVIISYLPSHYLLIILRTIRTMIFESIAVSWIAGFASLK